MLNVNEFIIKAKNLTKQPTYYSWGNYLNRRRDNHLLTDCSGLIKGILWGYPENGKYGTNAVPDINADTIISRCLNISNDFSNITMGEVVWLKGHIGIYIGEGKVIEATPIWANGVQITACSNIQNISGLHSRSWSKHGKLPYINYQSTSPTTIIKESNLILQEANKYGLKIVDFLPDNVRFYISEHASIYGGSSYGVKIPTKILKASTLYTSKGQKVQHGCNWVLVKELNSWVKVSECLVK